LSRSGRPRNVDASQGRFLACRQGFYDPAVFTSGREVTVVGNVAGSEARTVGEFKLELPRIEAETIYLWPQRVDAYYYDRPDWIWWSSGYRGWFGPSMRHHRVPQPRPQEPRPGG
jgi:outer membrane lipoprotein